MRLREFMEMQQKAIKESAPYESNNIVDVMKDCYYNPTKPASYFNTIKSAYYDAPDPDDSYGANKAIVIPFEDAVINNEDDFWDDYSDSPVENFGDCMHDLMVDNVDSTGEFFQLQVPATDGSVYDFYMAVLPAHDLNFEQSAREIIAVNKDHDTCEINPKAYDLFIKVLDEYGHKCSASGMKTTAEAIQSLLFSDDEDYEIEEDDSIDDDLA